MDEIENNSQKITLYIDLIRRNHFKILQFDIKLI